MAALTKAGVSKRGKPSIIHKNNYSYVENGGTETTIYIGDAQEDLVQAAK